MQRLRFWRYHAGSYVRLTIRKGQVIDLHGGGPTDEGASWWWCRYTFDGINLRRESGSRGRDCDGSYCQVEYSMVCYVSANVRPSFDDPSVLLPEWRDDDDEKDVWRDYTAEAAGY